jgi:protein-L-isoaspartate(D-aspartate) O-methyltransferase
VPAGASAAYTRDDVPGADGPQQTLDTGQDAMNIEAPSIARRGCVGLLLMAVSACSTPRSSAEAQQSEQRLAEARAALVQELRLQGIESDEVLDALGRVPRERFVPPAYVGDAYANHPLPIGHGQTISQPFVVALMSEVLDLEAGDRVLEIGTGSGYQAAILAELECEVFTIEIIEDLAVSAAALLQDLGYDRVHVLHGDGYLGWPEEAPFDKVIVTAAPEEIPAALVEQLRVGGKMIIPVGPQGAVQQLTLLEKDADGKVETTAIIPVSFVPMVR